MTDFVSEAKELLKTWEFCNVGLLQRKLRTGYVTAARVVEELRGQGLIGAEYNIGGHGYPVLIGRQANTACNGQGLCPECDSAVLPSQYCMMGHWCGERPATNA